MRRSDRLLVQGLIFCQTLFVFLKILSLSFILCDLALAQTGRLESQWKVRVSAAGGAWVEPALLVPADSSWSHEIGGGPLAGGFACRLAPEVQSADGAILRSVNRVLRCAGQSSVQRSLSCTLLKGDRRKVQQARTEVRLGLKSAIVRIAFSCALKKTAK